MSRCAGIKRDGGKCTATVEPPNEYCWWHDPANATQRKRAAAKGGKSKPNRELQDIKTQLSEMVDMVLTRMVPTAPYAVANQILNTQLRAIELERKIKEQDDLVERLEALESAPEHQKGERRGYAR